MVKNIALLGVVAALASVSAAPAGANGLNNHENRGYSWSYNYNHGGPKNCKAVTHTVTVSPSAIPTQVLAAQPSADAVAPPAQQSPSQESAPTEAATTEAANTEPAAPPVSSGSASLAESPAASPSPTPTPQTPSDSQEQGDRGEDGLYLTPNNATLITANPTPADVAGDSAIAKQLLHKHNYVRLSFNASLLTWDVELAKKAEAQTAACNNDHEGGDNLYWQWGQTWGMPKDTPKVYEFPSDGAVCSWAQEWYKYKKMAPGFSYETGHFTAMVWKSVTKVGCSWKLGCPDKNGQAGPEDSKIYLSCHYDGTPNLEGRFEQEVGALVKAA